MKLLEEELEMSCLFVLGGIGHLPIGLAQSFTQSFSQLRSLLGGRDALVLDILEINVSSCVSGRHEVVVINELNEGFDLSSSDEPLLGQSPSDVPWGSIDTHNESAGEFPGLVPLIVALDDDGLLPCMPARGKDDDSSSFEDLAHRNE